ncbi:HD domain-containing protein [Chitinophaga nivalis]|uniref:Metal-dependent HD superfamily phosphohydrolase n=1 Tax=Chitinophaga nivalis TaxID=2991709 RepID=A0ABT3IRG4_9BACT|nr:hypothetical protein [Chitinophaga nivalis]MCW3463737.1 hypothetical protein [Chitinophaga nivalis]MCW3486573.1 hypothetical protein [Chitinophaga nivalis]
MFTATLRTAWSQLHKPYTQDDTFIHQTFEQLLAAYGSPNRYYHNLSHIHQLLTLQQQYAAQLQQTDVVLFAIFFHDVVYNVLKTDNEAKSALAAEKHLRQLGYPADKTALVKDYIIATQTHLPTQQDTDLDFFLDFDLQILGTAPDNYIAYTQQIRREYGVYPKMVYNPGRKKALQHFLDMPAIYCTHDFRTLYETPARKNIQEEITRL